MTHLTMGTRFRVGDAVRVLAAEKPDHVRTPDYVKGRAGSVEMILGEFRNPESLAYGGDGLPKRPLYKVGFRQTELWVNYAGSVEDTLYIDIYEHWLKLDEGESR